MADFQNRLISRIFGVFFQRFFAQNKSSLLVKPFFRMFLAILIFDSNWTFCKASAIPWAIVFARWQMFKIVSFLGYLVFFPAFLCTEQLYCAYRYVSRMFLDMSIFDQTDHFEKATAFAWAIASGRWAILKIVSFLEYLVFFPAVFLHRTSLVCLYICCSNIFGHFNF